MSIVNLLATWEKASVILGKSWIQVKEKVLELINRNVYLIGILGRAGSGKTHLLKHLAQVLKQEYVTIYIDLTQLSSKSISSILTTILLNDELRNLIKRVVKFSKCKDLPNDVKEVKRFLRLIDFIVRNQKF